MNARVEVVIVTFRRPQRLRAALASLAQAECVAPRGMQVGVTVVDDDPDGSAEGVLDLFDGSFSAGRRYVLCGSQNISKARNRAIETVVDDADWLASIDDDVLVPVGWFTVCAEALANRRFNAVTGPLIKDFSAGAPWLRKEPFDRLGILDGADGQRAAFCATGNNWVKAAFLREHADLRFDPSFGVTGGEDMEFFQRAVARGLSPRFALRCAVTEVEPAERCTLRYQLRRSYWLGISEARVSRRLGLATRPHLVLRAGRRGVNRGARWVPSDRLNDRGWRWSLTMWANAAGVVAGAAGVSLRHR